MAIDLDIRFRHEWDLLAAFRRSATVGTQERMIRCHDCGHETPVDDLEWQSRKVCPAVVVQLSDLAVKGVPGLHLVRDHSDACRSNLEEFIRLARRHGGALAGEISLGSLPCLCDVEHQWRPELATA